MPATLTQKKNRLLASLAGLLLILVTAGYFISNNKPSGPVFTELDNKSVTTISVESPGQFPLRFEKSQNGWYSTSPVKRKADPSRIQILLATLSIQKGTLYPASEINGQEAGLTPARAVLTLNDEQFLFGNKEANGDRRYLQTGEHVALTTDIVFPLFSQGIIGFVEKNLIPAGIAKVKTPAYSVDKSSGTWTSGEMTTSEAESKIAAWLGLQFQEIVTWPLTDEGMINSALHQYVTIETSDSQPSGLEFFVLPELVLVHADDANYAMIITREQFATLGLGNS